MSEMIEKVARALVDGNHMGVSLGFTETTAADFGSVPALRKRDTERAIAAARTVIEVMREATDEMVAAGLQSLQESTGEPLGYIDRDPWLCYRAMLNAALK